MKFNDKVNNVQTNVDNSEEFGVAKTAEFFNILSNNIYTKPIRACIRELLSNAIDANLAAGVKNPVKMHLPTKLEPTFYIQDAGIGMTEEKMLTVYFNYGASDKKNTNEQIGGLGLGAKTPFAYCDEFTVESSKDGKKNTYIAYRNETGMLCRTHVEDNIPAERSGTKVEFVVQAKDFNEFYEEAVRICKFSMQMPEIVNGETEFFNASRSYWSQPLEEAKEAFYEARKLICDGVDKEVSDDILYEGIYINMGGVEYRIHFNDIKFPEEFEDDRFFKNKSLVFNFPIGSLPIQASREALNFDSRGVCNSRLVEKMVNYYFTVKTNQAMDCFKKSA